MKENINDLLVPLNGCAKSILGRINDAQVGWVLNATGIVVDDVTADGLPYCRIHDSYAGFGFGQLIYKPAVYRGKKIDYPQLCLTPKGIAALANAFGILLATADKTMVQVVVGRSARSIEDVGDSAVKIPKFDREEFMSDIKNRRIKSSHAAA